MQFLPPNQRYICLLLASEVQKFLQLYPIKSLQHLLANGMNPPLYYCMFCSGPCLTTTVWSIWSIWSIIPNCHGGYKQSVLPPSMYRYMHIGLSNMSTSVRRTLMWQDPKAADCRCFLCSYREVSNKKYLLTRCLPGRYLTVQ